MSAYTQKLLIISAPSGAGKTTLVNRLMALLDIFTFSISATTRQPRAHEQNGVHYYFHSEEEFRRKIALGEFVEWEEVYPGRLYGTLRQEVDRILAAGKCPIFDVDVEGGLHLKEQYGIQAISVFIAPPREDVLAERLRNRGTDSPEEIQNRLSKAHHELTYADKFDYQVVNDDLERATAVLLGIVEKEFFLIQDSSGK